jgi:plastocyanin
MLVRRRWAPLPLALAAGLLLGAQSFATRTLAQETTPPDILALGAAFDPREVVVATGTPVVWSNRSVFPHTVDFDDRLFEGYLFHDGDTLTWTPTEPGLYLYYCRYHGSPGGMGMAGVVVVMGDPARSETSTESTLDEWLPENVPIPEPVEEPPTEPEAG